MDMIIVSEENINIIARILDHDALKLEQKWSDVASRLGVSSGDATLWRQNYQLGLISFQNALYNVLFAWKEDKEKDKNLQKLCEVLIEYQLTLIAESIQSEFGKVQAWKPGTIPELYFQLAYLPRRMSRRTLINPALFKELRRSPPTGDIFLMMTGPEGRKEIVDIAGTEDTDLSGNQVLGVTVRFILAEDFAHFRQICKLTEKNVHWINYTNGNFYHLETHGSLRLIQRFMQENMRTMAERELFKNQLGREFHHKPVLIVANPGIGMTQVLISIARQVQAAHKDRLVLYFAVLEFVELFGHIDDDPEELLETIITETNSTSNDIKLELFLDGFEELRPNQITQAYELLKSLRTLEKIRLHISSSINFRDELEEVLGVFSYQLLTPFKDTQERIDFIKKIWVGLYKATDNKRLDAFANFRLQQLEKIEDSEAVIAGILLQYRMIAEIYSSYAVNYSNRQKLETPDINIHSIVDLFQELIHSKFSTVAAENVRKMLLENHVWSAMRLIFPLSESLKLPECLQHHNDITAKQMDLIGLMERRSNLYPKFSHHTIAQFLTAQHLIKHKNWCKGCVTLLIKNVLGQWESFREKLLPSSLDLCDFDIELYRFEYPVLNYFINGLLGKEKKHYEATQSLIEELKNEDANLPSSYELLLACVVGDFSSSFEFIQNILEIQLNEKQATNLLLASAKFSKDFSMIKLVVQLVQKSLKMQFYELSFSIASTGFMITPLHLAIHKGKNQMTKYFLDMYGQNEPQLLKHPHHKYLLHTCVHNTIEDDPDTILEKQRIIELILKKSKEVLEERFPSGAAPTPLLQDGVHPQLIKTLVEHGADINAVDEGGNTLLHKISSESYSSGMYTDVFNFALSKNFKLLKHMNNCGEMPLHTAVEHVELEDKVLRCFQSQEVDFNAPDNLGNSILLKAVKKRSYQFIKKLIGDYGCTLSKNTKGENALHIAVQHSNHEVIEYLLKKNLCNVNDTDTNRDTALHWAVTWKNELIQNLLVEEGQDLDLKVVNSKGFIPLMYGFQNKPSLSLDTVLKMEEKGLNMELYANQALQSLLENPLSKENHEFAKLFPYFVKKGGKLNSFNKADESQIKKELFSEIKITTDAIVAANLANGFYDIKTTRTFKQIMAAENNSLEEVMVLVLQSGYVKEFWQALRNFNSTRSN